MNPRLPKLLDMLVGVADQLVRAQDRGPWIVDPQRRVLLDQLYGELHELVHEPQPDKIVDETALLLIDCLRHLDERAGPLGDTVAATKWRVLAQSLLVFVRTDFANAQGYAAVPDRQDYAPARVPLRHTGARR